MPDSAPLGLIGDSNNSVVKRKRIVKRAGIGSLSTVAAAATARETKRVANAGNSSNKRRRDWDDEENAEPEYMARRGQQQQQHTLHGCANTGSMEKDGDVESDLDLGMSATEDGERQQEPPRTPPRHRISPLAMPLGLERADYHSVPEYAPSASMSATSSSRAQAPEHQRGQSLDAQRQESKDGSADVWTSADDRLLVELVLEKLHLTRDEWADCARSLGRDRGSVGRRWRSLVAAGEIGVLFSSSSPSGSGNGASRVRARGMGVQRGRICSTWR